MKVLLDTSILLDVLLARDPWVRESSAIWQACDEGRLSGYISGVSPSNIFYIVRKIAGFDRAIECVKTCLEAFDILPLNQDVLREAAALAGKDYEDNIHIVSARTGDMERIITRDATGFALSPTRVVTPQELLLELAPK